jgi:hypothetical protein
MADRYPLKTEKHSHGELVAATADEERAFAGMGWVAKPDTPPEYEAFPCWLRGEGLPDLLAENAEQARAAALRGYKLLSDAQVQAASEAFSAAYMDDVEDYTPVRYPALLRHPDHREAVPMKWRYHPGPSGHAQATAIPPVPEHLPDVEVSSAEEELEWTKRGWTIGSQFAHGAAVAHETALATEATSEAEKRATAPPPSKAAARKRPSGAQWRKRRREQTQAEQPAGSP